MAVAQRQTVVVWGTEEEKKRYTMIHGESRVEQLLQSITGASLQHLTFFDKYGIPFADVHNDTLVKQIGFYNPDMGVWFVYVKTNASICQAQQSQQQTQQQEDIKQDDDVKEEALGVRLMQSVHTSTSTVVHCPGDRIPWTTNYPSINQGLEALSVTITPKSRTSILRVHANLIGKRENVHASVAALFRSDCATALCATCNNGEKKGGWNWIPIIVDHEMQSGVTNEIQISIRISGYSMNGRNNNTSVWNGAMRSSLRVDEYK